MDKKISLSRSKNTIILECAVICALIIAMVINNFFMVDYYRYSKIKAMKNARDEISDAFVSGNFRSKEFEADFKAICERHNVNILIMDYESKTLLASGLDYDDLSARLVSYIFGQNKDDKDTVIEKTDRYEIHHITGKTPGDDYIDMWGVFDNGDMYLIRSPMQAILDSARATSSLINYLIIILFIASLFITALSLRMATISELKMTNQKLMEDIRQKEELENMRSEFLSGVSHELKTPIALISGYAEGLKEDINKDQSKREHYCDVIIDEASRMNEIVQKLIDLDSIEFGQKQLDMTDFDLYTLVSDCLKESRILCEKRGVNLEFPDSGSYMINADAGATEEIFRNYFSNALNHVSDNGTIRITFKREDDKTGLFVFNTGDPIPVGSLPRIWEKFYKVDKARSRQYGGSGVGLSVVKALSDKMGASYGVDNKEDGVLFYIYFKSVI